jgi:Icc-related predicted phosphoesterase
MVLDSALAVKKPILAILGNMDPRALEPALEISGISLNGNATVIGGVGFVGVSASPYSPLHTPNEVPDEVLGITAEKGWSGLPPIRWNILVAHTPPFGTTTDMVHSGAHVGSPALRRFVERRQPDAVLCGHIHEARGIDRIGKSQIVNCGPAFEGSYAILETGTDMSIRLVP